MDSETQLLQSSEEWGNAHITVNTLLSEVLNTLRDHGYNPGYHVSYDRMEQHLVIEDKILQQVPRLSEQYSAYLSACQRRDKALTEIQQVPKLRVNL
ncbi:hypothetical protein D2Q93_01930 [Alicyclobacillaceae bacterium I2511]|nr:hypothetical protein D2Q93_01930 [Alicyclobacillaceae bacterium I2511]